MKALLALLVCLGLAVVAQAAEVRTFREVNGRTHAGSFQKVQGDKVQVRVRNKTVPVSFWLLSKADQLYVLEQIKSDPLASRDLKPAEDPRKWTDTRGNSVTARFIEVKSDGKISVAIEANRSDFPFGNFSNEDQQYVRQLVQGTPAEQHLPKDAAVVPGAAPNANVNANPALANATTTITGLPNNGFPGFPGNTTSTVTTNLMGHGANAGHGVTPSSGYNPMSTNIGAYGPMSSTNPMSSSHAATGALPMTSIPMTSTPTTPTPMMPTPTPAAHEARMPPPRIPEPIRFVSTCSKCNKEVPDNATKCPHCGVTFGWNYDSSSSSSSSSTSTSSSWRSTRGTIRLAIFLMIGVGGWIIRKMTGSD